MRTNVPIIIATENTMDNELYKEIEREYHEELGRVNGPFDLIDIEQVQSNKP
jgi:hypothetical protein